MKKMFAGVCGLLVCLMCLPTTRADEAAVREVLADYVDVFNDGAHQKISEFWTENGSHIDRETGERTVGRDAIQADMRDVLTDGTAMKLSAQIDRIRLVTPDVAGVEGETTLVLEGEQPVISAFTALLVKQDGKWLLESLEEMPVPQPGTPADALGDLAWLVGNWVDEGDGVKVTTTFRWTASRAFLLRSFAVESADGVTLTGTQVIGWDPRGGEIRSWSFNSDGSFGESAWSQDGGAWRARSVQTLASGEVASGTYVMERVSDDSFTVQLIGRELDGEPQPTGAPVTVVRVPDESSPAPASKN